MIEYFPIHLTDVKHASSHGAWQVLDGDTQLVEQARQGEHLTSTSRNEGHLEVVLGYGQRLTSHTFRSFIQIIIHYSLDVLRQVILQPLSRGVPTKHTLFF